MPIFIGEKNCIRINMSMSCPKLIITQSSLFGTKLMTKLVNPAMYALFYVVTCRVLVAICVLIDFFRQSHQRQCNFLELVACYPEVPLNH
jgi:hypothetical protein